MLAKVFVYLYGSIMRGSGKKKIIIFLTCFILLIIIIFGVIFRIYSSRPPLLIVTDSSFETLYGEQRLKRIGSRLSRKLFRRIIPVFVSETAGFDLIAIAVEDAHESPEAVFFPFRYFDGARFYNDSHPEIPVYILAGANQRTREETALPFIRTDTRADLFRAGLCAALFAGDDRILFLSDGNFTNEQLEAFQEGLRIQGYLETPLWVNSLAAIPSLDDVGCVIVTSVAPVFLDENSSVPVLLFSWIDHSLTPSSVKVIFDDSPWTLIPEAFESLPPPGEEIFISSMPVVLKDRIAEKKDFRKLKNLLKENFEK